MPNAVACLLAIDRLVEDGNQILLAVDFDGTLCPIADCPSNVVIPRIIHETLQQLSRSPRFIVCVISDLALDDLMRGLPFAFIFAGNQGLAIQGPGFRFEHPGARRLQPQLAKTCECLLQAIAPWKEAWVEDKILTAAVHYRQVAKAERYELIRAVRQCVFSHHALFGIRTGREAIELHPRVAWDKGASLRWIKHRVNMDDNPAICISDDPTDESMFAVDGNQLNISVGRFSRSKASFHVADVFDVAALLAHLERAVRVEPDAAGLIMPRSYPRDF